MKPELKMFLEILQAANRRIRLVGDASWEELALHAEDSLAALRTETARARGPARCVDVGSGGGFPGVPLRSERPDWSFTFLDSVKKKADFLQAVVDRLSLKNCRAVWGRAEEVGRDPAHRETYELAFCRAVGPFAAVAELTLPLLRVGGVWFAHRGELGDREPAAAARALDILGGRPIETFSYRPTGKDKPRYIVCVEKIRPTPPAYPRRAGMPAKRPLG
jgi:16S rRNA (guanine527-N7)-methyltransferase